MSLTTLFGGIADAIRAKDGTTDPIVANDFPARIQAIPSGGKPGTPLDPVQVYRSTRPADWLPMPEPQANEIYLLLQIPDGASSLLAFTVTSGTNNPDAGDTYEVSIGTVVDGQFVLGNTLGPGGPQPNIHYYPSGETFEDELLADDFGDLTSDGLKQAMVKITASGSKILTWAPSTHSKKTSPENFIDWNIVEASCRLPSGNFGFNTVSLKGGNTHVRYCSVYEANNFNNGIMVSVFYNCTNLIAIPKFDTSHATGMMGVFYGCTSLIAVPEMDMSHVTGVINLFNGCTSLSAIPKLNAKFERMNSMFYGCTSLTATPELDTSQCTRMNGMFEGCTSLISVQKLDISSNPDMTGMFQGCTSLASVTLNPDVTGAAGDNISLADCSLGHQALVNLFNSLPTITAAKTLTLTGNPGVAELTNAEKAIATGKNWTLTL